MDNSRFLTSEQFLEQDVAGFMRTTRQEETMLEVGQLYAEKANGRRERALASVSEIAKITRSLEAVQNDDIFDLRLEAVVPLDAFHYWQSRAGDMGENPWTQEEFWDEYLRDNPECRVNTVRPVRIIVPDTGDDFNFSNKKEKEAAAA